ncbi:hypothetical protein D917_06935, partial [Trichinella nativa]
MAVFKERIGLVPPEWIPDEQWRISVESDESEAHRRGRNDDSQQGSAEQISSDVLRASCVLKKSAYPKAQSKNVTFEDGVCPGEVDSRRVNMFADSLSSSHTVQPKND